ncbi:MAG: cytochrome c [Pseudomonadota bacterium]
MSKSLTATLILCTAICAGTAFAAGHAGNPAVTARKAHMQLYGHNLGILGGMARGNTEYNAEAASAAAANLAALAQLDQTSYWAPGTDSDALPGESKALPALWENIPDAIEKGQALATAAIALSETAGTGLEAVQAGLGPVGRVCGQCHEAYQLSDN